MCIYYKYTIYLHFSGPNSVSFPLFFPSPPLPSLALWWICLRAFSSWAKAWMHIPRFGFVFVFFFLWNGYYRPRGELRSENQSSYDPLRVVFYITLWWVEFCWARLLPVGLFGGVWWMPSLHCWSEILLTTWLFCWSQYGQRNKIQMAGQTSVNIFLKKQMFCMCVFYVVMKYFLKAKPWVCRE